MHGQRSNYFNKIISKHHSLLATLENVRNSFNKGGALATPLKLLIVFHKTCCVYGVKKESLNFLFTYLKNRKQRVRPDNTYSEWMEMILFSLSQVSILGPLLFDIVLCDCFLFLPDIPIANMWTTTPHIVLFWKIQTF